MKKIKRIIVMMACVVLLWGQTVRAVAVPMLPYIPPHDVQMFDMLFNAFGLTVPDIEDDTKRLEGYWKLFEMASIANIEATKALIQKAFDNAKTSRVIELTPEDIDSMRLIGKVALSDGVQSGYEPPVADLAQVHQQLAAQGISIGLDTLTNMYTYAKAQLGYDLSLCYIWGFRDSSNTIIFGWHNKANRATFNNAVPYRWQVQGDTWITQHDITPTGVVGNRLSSARYAIELSSYWTGLRKAYDFGEKSSSASVTAQNVQISDAITQGTLIPITADTVAVEGVIDATKPLRIHLPVDLPIPAESVQDLPDVQEKLGTVPMSEDVEETISQLQEQQATQTGDISDYGVDLTRLFPFCIPFDLVRILSAFSAEPEAPYFEFPLPSDIVDNRVIFTNYEFSLDWLSPVMVWVRRGELILGGIGILLMTRDIIRG